MSSWPPILFHYVDQCQNLEWIAASVFDAVAQGVFAVEPGKVFPLTAAAAAHAELGSCQTSGPLLLVPLCSAARRSPCTCRTSVSRRGGRPAESAENH